VRLGMSMRIGEAIQRLSGPVGPFSGHATLATGLYAYYPLSEDLIDVLGAFAWETSSNISYAAGNGPTNLPANVLKANGTPAYFEASPGPLLATHKLAGGEFSWNLWHQAVKVTADGGSTDIFRYTGLFDLYGNLYADSVGSVAVSLSWHDGAWQAINGAITANHGGWHMYTITKGAGGTTLYIDGVSQGNVSRTQGINASLDYLYFGWWATLQKNNYTSVGLWEKPLSQPEVTALYNAGDGVAY
jgi:hypothetical protein